MRTALFCGFSREISFYKMSGNIVWPLLFLFFMLNEYVAISQERYSSIQVDSLRKELVNKKGFDKISIQLELASRIMRKDRSEAVNLANSSLKEARAINNKALEMRAYYVKGRISELQNSKTITEAYYDTALVISATSVDNWLKGEILYRKGVLKQGHNEDINALKYFNESIQVCRICNNYKIMGSSYSMMGTIFRVNGLYDRAIEYIINAKLNYEKAGSVEGKAWSAYILGRIYADLKLPEKALEYFQEALKIYTNLASIDGNDEGVAICNEQIGLLNLDSGNYAEARKCINKTLEIHKARGSKYGLSNAHKNLGIIEYTVGNYNQAEQYLNEAIRINKEVGDLLTLPTIYEHIGLCYIKKGQLTEGFKSLNQGLNLAISNNQKKIQLNIYSKLTEAYLSINDLSNAIRCQKKQIEIQDLILSGAANIKIEQLQAIYEIDRKNGQIIELERQNELNTLVIRQHRTSQLIMIVGILVALLISGFIYLFYAKIRNKNIELRETNAAKDKLFAIVAHDLRGPTRTLTVFLEHLNDSFDALDQKELKEILSSLYESSESVNTLLENLLIWAKSQLNKIEFHPEKLDVREVVNSSLKGLRQSAEDKQIKIELELDVDNSVWADSNMVQTIVRNLVSNAIKFTHREGSVFIRAEEANANHVRIVISDNGVGIEKSLIPKIFDLSNTLHTPGTENEKSTGLGLILVKDFVEKNKGTITIDSEKNKGTTVSFTLPKA